MKPPSDQVPGAASSVGARREPVEQELELRIDRDGTWFYRGSPIRRIALVKLFATVLRREADGTYWLQTPVERGRIEVEDVPFVGVELEVERAGSSQNLHLRTNLDQWVTLGPEHRLRLRRVPWQDQAEAGPAPYVEVRPGLDARLVRPVFYELVELGQEREMGGRRCFGVCSAGAFFPLDEVEPS